jgi:hypothetical protein
VPADCPAERRCRSQFVMPPGRRQGDGYMAGAEGRRGSPAVIGVPVPVRAPAGGWAEAQRGWRIACKERRRRQAGAAAVCPRRQRRRRRSRSRPVSLPGHSHRVGEGVVRLGMLAGRHQAGLPVLFGGEPFGGDVGDPDLHQLRALGAQLVPGVPATAGSCSGEAPARQLSGARREAVAPNRRAGSR